MFRQLIALFMLAFPAARAMPALAAGPADRIAAGIDDPVLAALVLEVLARNPGIEAARARSLAADQGPALARGWPDPMLRASGMLEPEDLRPEMMGLEIMLAQEIPARGKRSRESDAARWDAAAAGSSVESARLEALVETRRWYLELARLDDEEGALDQERRLLRDLQEAARGRFAAGDGRQHDVLRAATEVTRVEMRLLDLQARREAARARLNALRDRPSDTAIGPARLPQDGLAAFERAGLALAAVAERPETLAADAGLRAAQSRIDLARRERAPDIEISGRYLATGSADDDADMIGFGVGLRLPVHRRRLAAMLEQAVQERQALGAERRALALSLERDVAETIARLDRAERSLDLAEDVLGPQAEASVNAAMAAYSAGLGSASEAIGAERMRVEAVLAASTARADRAVAVAELEGLVGSPLDEVGVTSAVAGDRPTQASGATRAPIEIDSPPREQPRARRPTLGR